MRNQIDPVDLHRARGHGEIRFGHKHFKLGALPAVLPDDGTYGKQTMSIRIDAPRLRV
jgi:hypothetical protein